MARLPKGVFGPFSGKVGPVVGATWNDIPYIRSRPKKKKKKKKVKSLAQRTNETKFRFVNQWMVPFHPYLMVGFQNFPADKPPISTAFSINYGRVVVGSYPDFDIDLSKVVISVGDLPGLTEPAVRLIAPYELELTWQQSSSLKASFDDQLMLVLYNRELELTDGFIGGIKRSAKKCSYEFDERLIGKVIDVYVAVTSLNRKNIADSVYLGRIVP